jgi:hypothetical protein
LVDEPQRDTQDDRARTHVYLTELYLRLGEIEEASKHAALSLSHAEIQRLPRDLIRGYRALGCVAIARGQADDAERFLREGLASARVDLVDEEILILTALARLALDNGNLRDARAFLEEVWEPARRGPYPIYEADALNTLAALEMTHGHTTAAIAAATAAYRQAWCDGPPYTYHWGLTEARAILQQLGAAAPVLDSLSSGR